MTDPKTNSNPDNINQLLERLIKVNGFADDLEIKTQYNILDLIKYSDPSGDGSIYCIFENKDGLFALQVYNGTTDKGFMPLFSNQQVSEKGYNYTVEGVFTDLDNSNFDLIGSCEYISFENECINIFLRAKVEKQSDDYLWYSKQEFLDIIESQLDEFPGFDFAIIKKAVT
jgi:hypothetical protein